MGVITFPVTIYSFIPSYIRVSLMDRLWSSLFPKFVPGIFRIVMGFFFYIKGIIFIDEYVVKFTIRNIFWVVPSITIQMGLFWMPYIIQIKWRDNFFFSFEVLWSCKLYGLRFKSSCWIILLSSGIPCFCQKKKKINKKNLALYKRNIFLLLY